MLLTDTTKERLVLLLSIDPVVLHLGRRKILAPFPVSAYLTGCEEVCVTCHLIDSYPNFICFVADEIYVLKKKTKKQLNFIKMSIGLRNYSLFPFFLFLVLKNFQKKIFFQGECFQELMFSVLELCF